MEQYSFDALKFIIGKAEGLKAFQRSIGAASNAVNAAAQIRVRAERRMGEELKKAPLAKGGQPFQKSSSTGRSARPVETAPSLAEIGITKDQSARYQLHDAMDDAHKGLRYIPTFLKMCFEEKVWQFPRILAMGGGVPPISFHEFVHTPFPQGLGATYETLRGFITADIELLAAFDAASQRNDGGNNNPSGKNQHTKENEVTVDNIHGEVETKPVRPTGTSAQAGLRRLDKAAADNPEAKAALEQIKAGNLSVHKACILLNFRKPPPTPLQALKREWRKASPDEKDAFRTWIDTRWIVPYKTCPFSADGNAPERLLRLPAAHYRSELKTRWRLYARCAIRCSEQQRDPKCC